MAQTKYITVAEFAEAHDTRMLADLSSDSGNPGTVNESNTILLNAIERASADVESYALRGERYSATDLTDLQTADDWTLKGLVADVAIYYAAGRRAGMLPDVVQEKIEAARRTLEDLRDGKKIFNDASSIAAGKPKVSITGPGRRENLGMVSTEPFFPIEITEQH